MARTQVYGGREQDEVMGGSTRLEQWEIADSIANGEAKAKMVRFAKAGQLVKLAEYRDRLRKEAIEAGCDPEAVERNLSGIVAFAMSRWRG